MLVTSIEKKALIITGLNKELHSLFPELTNKSVEQLIVINSYGTVISDPYSCLIRNILLAVYCENVEEIYIIGERNSKENHLNKEELLSKMQEAGISQKTIETLEYMKTVGSDLFSWAAGDADIKKILSRNTEMIKHHPLLPKTVSVYGFIANTETGEVEAI
ncbi:hypothetical protein [Bacillus taeanensis]|uniref:Carbonic anhydrase n=1 Tax=Bacillus taeanensis TaxID=273032 RepID=A0A366XND2_9BACI|nr:hypothetical protein [Bacillus taeanensis]RBW67417.1 hypothetical protein DS031_22385 [Bacillus taeanensis]